MRLRRNFHDASFFTKKDDGAAVYTAEKMRDALNEEPARKMIFKALVGDDMLPAERDLWLSRFTIKLLSYGLKDEAQRLVDLRLKEDRLTFEEVKF